MRSTFAVFAFGAALSLAIPLHKRQDFDVGGGGDFSDSFDSFDVGNSDQSFELGSGDTSTFTEPTSNVVAFNDPEPINTSTDISAIEKLIADNTAIPTEAPADNVTPAPAENVTPAPAENVTPPAPENVTPPAPENVTPPTPEKETPPTAENQTPKPDNGAIALAPSGITSETLNPPTGDTKTTADDDAEFFDAIDDALAETPTTTPTDNTPNTTPADDSSILTDEDLDGLDAFLKEDTPTPVTGNDAANNVFPDAKVSASPDDVFSNQQISNVANFVSDFAFTPGKTFDFNELASIFPNAQPSAVPDSGSGGGGGGSSRSGSGRGTSGTSGRRPAAYNANNDILQKGVALAFNQLAKLLNPAPAQNSPANRPIRIVTVRPVPATRRLITTTRLLASPVVTPVPIISRSALRSGIASVTASASASVSASGANTASISGSVDALSPPPRSGSILASTSVSSPVLQISSTSAPPASSSGGG